MTNPDNQKNDHRIDRHTDEPWIIGMFAVCGLMHVTLSLILMVAAFVLFVAANPDAGKLASDIAQAEFPIIQSAPATADAVLPAPRPTTQLASGR